MRFKFDKKNKFKGGGGSAPPVNLVVNGTYDTDTVWDNGPGWSIAGGVAVGVPDAVAGDQSQPLVLPAGQYRCEFKLVTRSAGSVRFILSGGSGATVMGALRSVPDDYSEEFTTEAQTTFAMRKTTTFNGTIDDVELYYLGPN